MVLPETENPKNMEVESISTSDPDYVMNQLAKLDNLDKLVTKIDGFQTFLQDSVSSQNIKIASLERRNSQLESSNFKLERAIDDLWKEVHGKNLILRGLDDSANESQHDLFQNVCELLRVITDKAIEPDVVYRMGEYVTNSKRPVRIVLCKFSERNLIFESRFNLEDQYTIAADLPTDMRIDFAMLFKKKEELAEQGETCKINFKAREITTLSGKGFASVHGVLKPLESKKLMNDAGFIFSKNGRGHKRAFPQPAPNGSVQPYPGRTPSKYRKIDQSNSRMDPKLI